MNTQPCTRSYLLLLLLLFSIPAFSQVRILQNQIGIGTPTPTAAIDIRSAANTEASRFQLGNLAATSKIQLLSGKKGDERSFLLFSPQDTFIFARHQTDTTEVMRFVPDGYLEIQRPVSALGNFKLQRAENDYSVYIGAETGTTTSSFSLNNVFIGYFSGRSNQTGSRNTFIGWQAGQSNQSGAFNTFVGVEAGQSNINGIENTALGIKAGASNTSGSENVFLGNQAGPNNTTGNVNIFIGRGAGTGSSTGGGNTFIGTNSGPLNAANSLDGAIAIGTQAQVDCSYCAVIGGTGDYAMDLGLGVPSPTAKLDVDGTVRIRNLPAGNGNFVVADGNGNLFLGGAAPLTNEVDISTLKAENQALRTELEAVKEQLDQLKSMVRELAARPGSDLPVKHTQDAMITEAGLRQNQPNPFRGSTRIEYFVPQSVNKAVLQITNAAGKLVQSIEITEKGEGETVLHPFALSAGTYFYSLVLDGKLLETKKMIFTAD
jgi:hypothetical protein